MTSHDEPLDRILAAAAAAATWPATPDLRDAVTARIAAPGTRARPTPTRGRPAVRALALALLALVLLAGVATALGYRLPGLDIVFGEPKPPAGTGLELGVPVTLDDALAVAAPRVLVPAALPEPATAFRAGTGTDPIVTLAWRAGGGDPTLLGSDDLSLVVMAVPGTAEEAFLSKVLGPGTAIEPVNVGGDRGWWISGAPHELLYLDPNREARVLRSVVAGDTLVFARDGTLYRLESSLGRDRTLEIAASMR